MSRVLVRLALTAFLVAGCAGRPETAEQEAVADSLRAQALIEAGNVALRAEDAATAAKRFASAAVVRPDDPAAFFGLGMALQRLGRSDEARVAYAKARDLQRGAGEAGADAPREVRAVPTVHP